MKKIFTPFILLIFVIAVNLSAQECTYYFPVKVGATIETQNFNAKDKLTGSAKSKVIEHKGNTVKFTSETFDNKGKAVSKGDYEIRCENNEVIVDMSSYLQGFDKNAYQGMEVKIDSKAMSIPSVLSVGQKLNDGEITMNVSNQGFNIMSLSTKIYNRKVEAMEDVTTPAGTYKCAKISYDIESKTIMLVRGKGIQWISSKAGVVRTENYDQKGLTGYSVLSSFSDN